MKDFEDKTVKVISKLTCDSCGEQSTPSDFAFHEFISINHKCGYGSIHGDGNQFNIDLCQQCFSDMCGDSLTISMLLQEDVSPMFVNIINNPVDTDQSRIVRKRVPENNESKLKYDSDLQIEARGILSANKIINKDELAVALKRVNHIFGPEQLSNKESEFYQLAELVYNYEGKRWDSY